MLSNYIFALMIFLWGLIATPVSIGLAEKFRLLDAPGGRKKHSSVMPRGAGIVLWSGYLLWALFIGNRGIEVPYIATGASIIFLLGYMDDMHPLPPLLRLLFQMVSSYYVALSLPVPMPQKLVFVLWITGMTNAFNLIDGMDGLCLSISFMTVLIAFMAGRQSVWLPLAALISGVLLWNFPAPRTFLGDGGSTLLGFICASHLTWSFSPGFLGMGIVRTGIILFFMGGMPVIDTLAVMLRRILAKKSPFLPDRKHAHHKLQDAGFSKGAVLAVLISVHSIAMIFGFYLLGAKMAPF